MVLTIAELCLISAHSHRRQAIKPQVRARLMGGEVGAQAGHLAPVQGEGHGCSPLVAPHAQHAARHAGRAHLPQVVLHPPEGLLSSSPCTGQQP